jgi:hypothetical protein
MSRENALKLFALNNLAIEADLRRITAEQGSFRGIPNTESAAIEGEYYPQFSEALRTEAAKMATHYAVFYCLENSIRDLVTKRLEEAHGPGWWAIAVPQNVRDNAEKNQKRELSTGVTPRSSDLIDFSTFGELGEIIKANWQIFGDMFRDMRGLERVLGTLNNLRAPIAHCKALAEDEVARLDLSLRDWFRQME